MSLLFADIRCHGRRFPRALEWSRVDGWRRTRRKVSHMVVVALQAALSSAFSCVALAAQFALDWIEAAGGCGMRVSVGRNFR